MAIESRNSSYLRGMVRSIRCQLSSAGLLGGKVGLVRSLIDLASFWATMAIMPLVNSLAFG